MNLNGKEYEGYPLGGKKFNTLNVGGTIVSTGRYPIESWKIWQTVADAKAFIMYDEPDAAAYVGMVLSVTDDSNPANNGLYVVKAVGANAVKNGSFDESAWQKIGVDDSSASDEILKIIEDNELVTAEALNDLRKKIKEGDITVTTLKGNNRVNKDNFAEYQIKKGGVVIETIEIPGDTSLVSCRYISENEDDEHAGSLELVYLLATGETNTVYVDLGDIISTSKIQGVVKEMVATSVTKTGADKDKLVDSKLLAETIEKLNSDFGNISADDIEIGDSDDEDFSTNIKVGFLDAGTTIPGDWTIRDILMKILTKELWSTKKTAPSVASLNIVDTTNGNILCGNNENSTTIVEVNQTIKPSAIDVDVTNGTIGTYNGTNIETTKNAGCTLGTQTLKTNGSVVTSYKPTSEETITFKYERAYSASTAKTMSNYGNENQSIVIPAGTATLTCTTRAAYKVWYGNLPYGSEVGSTTSDRYDFFSNVKSSLYQDWTPIGNKLEIGSLVDGSVNRGTAVNGNADNFYLICPSDYILYGEQMQQSISVTNDGTFTYNDRLYTIYHWDAVKNTYNNVSMKKNV